MFDLFKSHILWKITIFTLTVSLENTYVVFRCFKSLLCHPTKAKIFHQITEHVLDSDKHLGWTFLEK